MLMLFSLAGRIHPRDDAHGPLVDRFDFGRFTPHPVSGAALLPVPVLARRLEPGELGLPGGDHGLALAEAGVLVVATPRGEATLLPDCESAVRPRPPRSPPGWPTPVSTVLRSPSAAVPCST